MFPGPILESQEIHSSLLMNQYRLSNAAFLPLNEYQTLPISLLYMVVKMIERTVVKGI